MLHRNNVLIKNEMYQIHEKDHFTGTRTKSKKKKQANIKNEFFTKSFDTKPIT